MVFDVGFDDGIDDAVFWQAVQVELVFVELG